MRKDLDVLMRERNLAGLVVFAYDRYSPAMYYAIGQKLHYGLYFRAADGRAHLVHDPMERDQAAAAGCDISGFPQHRLSSLLETEGTPARAYAKLIVDVCLSLGIAGPIALLGDMPATFALALAERIRELEPRLTMDLTHPDLIALARSTKEPGEVNAIRRASQGAVAALDRVVAYIRSLRVDGSTLRMNGGPPITLGDVRREIHQEFLAHGLAEEGESIVSQGRDAGVPHNRGNDQEPLKLGTPLLIDIFPGEAGGGYFSDMTRTYCIGPAPKELRELYDHVHDAFSLAMSKLEAGRPCRSFQELVYDRFEALGHPTQRSKPGTEEGYVHGLGHGVGLSVHEAPRLGGPPSYTQTLEPGMVITVEPGLYYPDRGLGARIEDLVFVREDGTMENLTPAPYELEIHPRG